MSFEATGTAGPGTCGRNDFHPGAVAALVPLLLAAIGCGHKAEPFPPPLRHPAATKDLKVMQRGDQLVLSFSYPQTTISGTPLEPLESVEVWELVRPVPEWTPPTSDHEGESDSEALSGAEAGDAAEDQPNVFDEVPGAGDDPSKPSQLEAGAGSGPPADELATVIESASEGAVDEMESADSSISEESDEEEAPEPPPAPPSPEELLKIDAGEFAATANLRATLVGPSLSAASFGDQLVVTVPIEKPVEVTQPSDSEEEAAPGGTATGKPEGDEAPEYGSILAIKTAVGAKLVSSFSNLAVIAHREPPLPPSTFSLEADQNRIAVRWKPGDIEVEGFHIYRRDAKSPAYGAPLAFVPLAEPAAAVQEDEDRPEEEGAPAEVEEREYSDRTAVLGQSYIYALTTVANRVPVAESAITSEREVDYSDRFAPSPPRNPLALAETGRIRLLWDASPEDDIAGYHVTRRDEGERFVRLTEELLAELEFSDLDVRSGRGYSYRVIAVDHSGNESQPSATVDVRVP